MSRLQPPSLLDDLSLVYGAAVADTVASALAERVAVFDQKAPQPQTEKPLGAEDVLMIAYGDSFTRGADKPLAALDTVMQTHLKDVVSGVHVLPFHPFSSDDGFSVMDYFKVNPALGEWGDINALAQHTDLMADAVVNHASAEGDWFKRYLADAPGFENFFFEADESDDLSMVVRPRTSPLLTSFTDSNGRERHIWTTFSADQVDLDYRNPRVLVAVVDVLLNLVANGARYLRLDAVTFLWKVAGSPSVHLDETHALIRIMREAVLAYAPQTRLITETNVPHDENISYFGNGHDEAHMVYNFALPPLIAHSLVSGTATALSTWAKTLDLPSDQVCFFNFTASHDGVGLRASEALLAPHDRAALIERVKSVGGFVSYRALSDGSKAPYEMNCSYVDLICGTDSDDKAVKAFAASQAIALAMPGVPALYVHSLFGSRNDHALAEKTGRARSINRGQIDLASLNTALEDETSFRSQIFRKMKTLLAARRNHPAFGPFAPATVVHKGDAVFALARGGDKSDKVLTLVNVSDEVQTITVAADEAGTDLISGQTVPSGKMPLQPHQVCWIARRSDNSQA